MQRSICVGLFMLGVEICTASMYAATPSTETITHLETVRPMSRHWAFQSIQPAQPPQVEFEAWIKNDIDRFVLHRLEQEGIAPSPLTDRRTLIRRLHADLIGLSAYDTGGELIGNVTAVYNHGAGDILEISPAGHKSALLLPFTMAIVPNVDLAAGRIVVDLPDETD